jgi:hypothetical protein
MTGGFRGTFRSQGPLQIALRVGTPIHPVAPDMTVDFVYGEQKNLPALMAPSNNASLPKGQRYYKCCLLPVNDANPVTQS